jgi:triacylglycerol lipase
VPAQSLWRDLRWWAEDYVYALFWQLRGLRAGEPNRYLSGDLRPIVILPGIWETWAFMVPLIKSLHQAGHPVHVLADLRRNNRSVAETATSVAGYLRAHDLHDVALVAHSKGGLIGKYAMTFLNEEDRISSMVAIAVPFSGSRYAPYLLLPSLRAFSPHDPTTVLLNGDVRVNSRILSIFGEFDPHIPEGSALQGATNARLPLGGHFKILSDSAAIALALEAVSNAAASPVMNVSGGPIGMPRGAGLSEAATTGDRRYDRLRRALMVTLLVDGANVLSLLIITLVLAAHGNAGSLPAIALDFSYVAVGLLGLGLAVGAVDLCRPESLRLEDLERRCARAQRFLLSGLSLNTILCALLLIGTRVGTGARSPQSSAGVSDAMGAYLLIGGDVLSVIYLVLVAALKPRRTESGDVSRSPR